MKNTKQIIDRAYSKGFAIPAFNIPHLPMVKPIIEAVKDENSFALIEVARLEWEKFASQSMQAVHDEFSRWKDVDHVRLHLDHIPVLDEDLLLVDYIAIIREAISLGFESVMVDGSRLSLNDNIEATRKASDLAHLSGIPCEAELGAVLGHESGQMPPYEEIFKSGKGFTKADEAALFVQKSGCDWLSVAIGNVHGAISEATRGQPKPAARLNIDHLRILKEATGIPLVLHGGSGIEKPYILQAMKNGIAKINVGTEVRQIYESAAVNGGPEAGRLAVYKKTRELIKEFFELSGTAELIK